jgi:uncharacterized membrane protein YebE (DUF533 family)
MHWSEQPLDIDGPTAALIAAGMRAVARADGDIHPQELALIDAFEADLPQGGLPHPHTALATRDLRAAYVRSLVMVALADGAISEVEREVIGRLVGELGVDEDELETLIEDVKRWFLDRFRGVTVFRDAVASIAQDLGLDPATVPAAVGDGVDDAV